jgi:hypothetical protein
MKKQQFEYTKEGQVKRTKSEKLGPILERDGWKKSGFKKAEDNKQ